MALRPFLELRKEQVAEHYCSRASWIRYRHHCPVFQDFSWSYRQATRSFCHSYLVRFTPPTTSEAKFYANILWCRRLLLPRYVLFALLHGQTLLRGEKTSPQLYLTLSPVHRRPLLRALLTNTNEDLLHSILTTSHGAGLRRIHGARLWQHLRLRPAHKLRKSAPCAQHLETASLRPVRLPSETSRRQRESSPLRSYPLEFLHRRTSPMREQPGDSLHSRRVGSLLFAHPKKPSCSTSRSDLQQRLC